MPQMLPTKSLIVFILVVVVFLTLNSYWNSFYIFSQKVKSDQTYKGRVYF